MKLYRIRYKKSFVTRIGTEEVEWDPPTGDDMPPTITTMPGVPVQHCEMIAAHWAERRVTIPEEKKMVDSVIPEHTEMKQVVVPGHYELQRVHTPAHYETQEIWIPEHVGHELKEIPGFYEIQQILVPEYYVTRYYWREASPARGLEAAWIPYQHLIPAGYKDQRVWIDATWEQVDVLVPGQFRDHRVWIEESYERKEVWISETTEMKQVTIPEMVISTPVVVPEHVERQSYWQEEYEKCWTMHPEQTVIAGLPVSPEYLAAMEEWFVWYQTTTPGQFFMDGAKTYGWLEEWTRVQVMQKAWQAYRGFQPDWSIRIHPDVVVKFNKHELDLMLRSTKGIEYLRSKGLYSWAKRLQDQMVYAKDRTLTEAEKTMLIKVGALAALVVAAGALVYFTWPGAKFEYKVTYTDWVYVLRYQESFTYADLVGVSLEGRPTFLICEQTGGPILREERGELSDMWYFGEEWVWSAYVEEGRWWGIGETRHWYEAEVEYLGYVKRSGAPYYTKFTQIDTRSTGGHEPGWTKQWSRWGEWEVEEEHERV